MAISRAVLDSVSLKISGAECGEMCQLLRFLIRSEANGNGEMLAEAKSLLNHLELRFKAAFGEFPQ